MTHLFSAMASLPSDKPKRPWFSSGPCVKPVEWQWRGLEGARLGQSHRRDESVALLCEVTDQLRQLLDIPQTHWVGLTPGSATGAIEMAMWNFLGPQPGVDIVVWDIFSAYWAQGLHSLLPGCVTDIRVNPGDNLSMVSEALAQNPHKDIVFTWCGTTHGVWMGTQGQQALAQRHCQGEGLAIADLASAVMTTSIPWHHLDVATFSWQKGLGGEAHLGVIVVGPRALHRWEKQAPSWAIPRLYRLTDAQGHKITGPFHGEMIHTCSMLIVEEYAMLLDLWRQRGGQAAAIQATERNVAIVQQWLAQEPLFQWVVEDSSWRAHGPVLLRPTAPEFALATTQQQWALLHRMSQWLAQENVGFDVVNHARAFPAIRLWCGPTVEAQDIKALLPWLAHAWRYALG